MGNPSGALKVSRRSKGHTRPEDIMAPSSRTPPSPGRTREDQVSIFETSSWEAARGNALKMEWLGLPLSLAKANIWTWCASSEGEKHPQGGIWSWRQSTHDGSAGGCRVLHGAVPESPREWVGWKRELKCHLLSLSPRNLLSVRVSATGNTPVASKAALII